MPDSTVAKPLRIFYAAGPGNILKSYEYWVSGQDDPSQVSVTYSGQFYQVCKELGAVGYAVSCFGKKEVLRDRDFTIENRPQPLEKASGIFYHIGRVWYGLGLIATMLRWRADVAVISNSSTHWFVLSPLTYLGIRVIPSLHCTLWRKYLPRNQSEQFFTKLSHHLFRRSTAILVASDDIAEQVKVSTKGQHADLVEFLPLYRRTEFSSVMPPKNERSPFKVLYIGRIEASKGVFDLLNIAKRFVSEGRQNIQFDLCGSGSALAELRQAASQAGLESSFICHGYCNKPELHQILSHSHVVIAPTTTMFEEGFCQVVAEGALAGRPIVTSTVCPALSYVRPAVVEVPPDDEQGYGDALLKLLNDHGFYEEKQQGSLAVQEQFYDLSKSWQGTLKSIVLASKT